MLAGIPERIIRHAATRASRRRAIVVALPLLGVACALPACQLVMDIPPRREATPSAAGGAPGGEAWDAASWDATAAPSDAAAHAPVDTGAGGDAGLPPSPFPPLTDGGPGDACTGPRVAWYPDADGDGYGRADATAVKFDCRAPGADWAAVAGDCADDDALVHPGQGTYFGTPYRDSAGEDSYDYDCSGVEEGDPALRIGPQDCGLLSLALCGGAGYAPTARAFPLNGYCGSGVWTSCETKLLDILVCASTDVRREPPYGCH